jgi:AcrR family transcriptional regulator
MIMAPKLIDKEEKKGQILKAAMRVFARQGIVKSKMADIAKASGIGKGTIYEYFRSKEDIFAEAYKLFVLGTEEQLGKMLASDAEPEEKLRKLMTETLAGLLGDGGEFAGIMMAFWSEGVRNKDERISEIINLEQIYAEYRQMIAALLEEGMHMGRFRRVDSFLTASVLIGAMDGILLQCIMDPHIFDPQEAVEVLLDTYLNGIRNSGREYGNQ